MTTFIKKVLSQKTKDWYIKWVASVILIVGITLTANNIVINSVSIVILLNGILNYYVK